MSDRDAFSPHMEAVARAMLGDPNPRLTTPNELRYGSNGSLSIDRNAGIWFDHERQVGGGGEGAMAASEDGDVHRMAPARRSASMRAAGYFNRSVRIASVCSPSDAGGPGVNGAGG